MVIGSMNNTTFKFRFFFNSALQQHTYTSQYACSGSKLSTIILGAIPLPQLHGFHFHEIITGSLNLRLAVPSRHNQRTYLISIYERETGLGNLNSSKSRSAKCITNREKNDIVRSLVNFQSATTCIIFAAFRIQR